MLTLLIGLIVTLAGGAAIVAVLFGHRAEPAAPGRVIRGVTMTPAKVTVSRRRPAPARTTLSGDAVGPTYLHLSWAARTRSGLNLALITLGAAALVATIAGIVVLALGVFIQQ